MTLMDSMKVGDIVSVEDRYLGSKKITVGKLCNISKGQVPTVMIQTGFQKFRSGNLSNCWNATPSQKKQYFKAMLSGK